MSIYRAVRSSPYNNWRYRLDIVPYDETLDGNGVTLDQGCVVSFGDLEYGFDDVLPYGLANPATWSVTLNFTRLPSDLQTRLRNKFATYSNIFGTYDAYNTFLYWTDSGTNGATWTLLFCGVVESVEGATYDVNDNGELETTYNLVDGAYHSMLQITSNLEGFPLSTLVQNGGLVKDYPAIVGLSQWRNEYGAQGNTDTASTYLVTFAQFCSHIQERLSVACWLRVTRFANTTPATNNFDFNNRMQDLINTGVRLTSFNTDGSGDAFSAYLLDSYSAHLIQYIKSGGETKGGLYSTTDAYSFSNAQCLKDLIADLCETFCIKMYWKPEYVVDVGGDYIRWNVEVATLLGNKRSNTIASSYDLTDAVSLDSITEGSGVIGKAETRVELEGGDKNITEFVTASARSRSERSINIEPILNNLPTPKDKKSTRTLLGVTYAQRESVGIDQTNSIFSINGQWSWGTSVDIGVNKIHHNTRVVVRGAANGGVASEFFDATSSAKPINAEEAEHIAWMNTVQAQAGIPKALTKALYNTFSGEIQSEVTISWRTDSATLVDQLGAVHNLNNGIATTLTQYKWDKACVVRVVQSFDSGTTDITYLLPSI